MLRHICIASFLTIAAFSPAVLQEKSKQEKQDPLKEKKLVLPGEDDNAVSRRDFMRTKLMFSQNILEGLTTGDFKMIENGIEEIHGVTEGAAWVAIDNDQYRKLTEDFKTTIRNLAQAAESKNLDAVALRYYNMSTSCIDCHKHIRAAHYEF